MGQVSNVTQRPRRDFALVQHCNMTHWNDMFSQQTSFTAYSYRYCFPRGRFEFEITDAGGDGLEAPGGYVFAVDGEEVTGGGFGARETRTLGSCEPERVQLGGVAAANVTDAVAVVEGVDFDIDLRRVRRR